MLEKTLLLNKQDKYNYTATSSWKIQNNYMTKQQGTDRLEYHLVLDVLALPLSGPTPTSYHSSSHRSTLLSHARVFCLHQTTDDDPHGSHPHLTLPLHSFKTGCSKFLLLTWPQGPLTAQKLNPSSSMSRLKQLLKMKSPSKCQRYNFVDLWDIKQPKGSHFGVHSATLF